MNLFLRTLERSPLTILFVVVGLLVVLGAGLPKVEFDDEPRDILRSDSEDFALLEEIWEQFGADDNETPIVLDGGSLFTVEGIATLERLVEELRGVEGVVRVTSVAGLFDFQGVIPRRLLPSSTAFAELDEVGRARVRERVLQNPLVKDSLVSSDGNLCLLVAHIDESVTKIEPLTPVVDGIVDVTERLSAETNRRVRATGIPSVRVELYRTARYEQVLFFSLASILCAFIAFWLYRDVRAVLVAAIPPFVGTIFAHGAFGWLGWKVDLLGTVIPMLVTVIGFTDSMHLTIHARHAVLEGMSPRLAAVDAVRKIGKACFLTSLTTAIGFGSLVLGSIETIGRFGEMCAVAMLLAFVAVLTVLPLLAMWLLRPSEAEEKAFGGGLLKRLGPWIDRRATRVAWVGVVLVVGLGWLSSRLETENHLLEATATDSDTYTALRDLESAFGGALPMYVLCEWPEGTEWHDDRVSASVERVTEFLSLHPDTGRAYSIFDLVAAGPVGTPEFVLGTLPNEITKRLIRADKRRLLVATPVPDGDRDVMLTLFDDVRAKLAQIEAEHPHVELSLTGTDIVARNHIHAMISDLARSLLFASVVIFFAISWGFGSFRIGLASVLPNLFPLVVVGGVIELSGRSLEISSAVVFSVLLGIAVDDTIHFLARWRHEAKAGREPLTPTLVHVGKTITWTTIVLAAGLAITLVSVVPTTRWFATLCITGLGAAWVGDLIFLPALMALMRRGRADS